MNPQLLSSSLKDCQHFLFFSFHLLPTSLSLEAKDLKTNKQNKKQKKNHEGLPWWSRG